MKILVTGGAGYIGSFMVKRLLEDNHQVVIVDSLERGHKNNIDDKAEFIEGNLLSKEFIQGIFSKNKFDGVIHFAGFISMAESMENPYIYFENNTLGALNVIEEMKKYQVNNFIFSSTAGVYGNPIKIPISEYHPQNPTNPYGESKLMVETMLAWYKTISGLNFAALRYFNACGAALDGTMGEDHNPETHIIPNAIRAVLDSSEFVLYGTDYNTPDGTCIRDYIHVLDLVESHILALDKLVREGGGYVYNVGTGEGHSNKEVISMIEKVSGVKLGIKQEGRRPGDADVLIADSAKIRKELGFEPKYSDLSTIVETAWKWHVKISNLKSQISK
ncbi:UDP-glucose 4-epimerase GalE [Candidatus Parcubacteria bacterium]|nr:MAG: UDP-glucose 4-epimerase GalE [Candidatus Parcubacteria bacterium]